MDDVSRLLQPEDLVTLGGATLAVTLITIGLHYAFGWTPKYVALIVSIVVAAIGVIVSGDGLLTGILVAIANAL